jgi:hypothetical protein
MSDQWSYDPQRSTWTITMVSWRGIVTRDKANDVWSTAIERIGSYVERYEGPSVAEAQEGRAWCMSEIARRWIPNRAK